MWPFKQKKKIDTTGAVPLTEKEYRTILELNASDPRVRFILDQKNIKLGSKTVKVTVRGETFLMSGLVDDLGTKFLG
jgi:hypothetical protein